ncbi:MULTISPECIES: hypothetical protein [unclassified Cyanobium]|uniref:hypothetical protein n=1 Tax=unclassified Cyanobium TaxID=2627006 RepID=UPI0020CBA07B|nr:MULTISPECIES: hypothetical protein [unclassified Cyanobium]MCP9777279.1 hypothetical protein [Cyanobium sp. Tous-M-B4]MCP9875652.1 hypothetical protein [Cyanobium sp. A2C-AMD]
MAAGLHSLSPLWRNSLRIWLASTLTIGILFWSGRNQLLPLALVMAVLFVNENDLTPARSIGQLVAGALIGLLTAIVLQEISTSWVVLGLAILLTGVLVRSLGLLKGLSTGYLSCWAVELMHRGNQFNWATIFDLAFAAVVGILMAQIATWALWPRRPLQQLPALEARIASQLEAQILAMQQWLDSGGEPPAALRSQDLLPSIQLLQQLRDQNQGLPMPAHTQHQLSRWAQAGSIWRQVLRQWLLLEPLLRQLATPVPAERPELLLRSTLADLAERLHALPAAAPVPSPSSSAQLWLEEAGHLGAPQPLLLTIGQQCQVLKQLLHSRALLRSALAQLSASNR